MRRVKILSMAFMAVFALAGLMAASASAVATLPNILPLGEETNPLEGIAKTGKSVFGSGGLSLTSAEAEGKFTGNAAKLGKFKELYKGVRGITGEICTGKGDAAGTVESTGTYHVRDWQGPNGKSLVVSLIFLVIPLTIECQEGGPKVVVNGCVAGRLTPEGKLTKTLTLKLNEGATKGDEEIITLLNEELTKSENCELKSSTNGGAFALSAQTQTTTLSEVKKAKAAVEVLVMPTP
jgi:hypothetical protein